MHGQYQCVRGPWYEQRPAAPVERRCGPSREHYCGSECHAPPQAATLYTAPVENGGWEDATGGVTNRLQRGGSRQASDPNARTQQRGRNPAADHKSSPRGQKPGCPREPRRRGEQQGGRGRKRALIRTWPGGAATAMLSAWWTNPAIGEVPITSHSQRDRAAVRRGRHKVFGVGRDGIPVKLKGGNETEVPAKDQVNASKTDPTAIHSQSSEAHWRSSLQGLRQCDESPQIKFGWQTGKLPSITTPPRIRLPPYLPVE